MWDEYLPFTWKVTKFSRASLMPHWPKNNKTDIRRNQWLRARRVICEKNYLEKVISLNRGLTNAWSVGYHMPCSIGLWSWWCRRRGNIENSPEESESRALNAQELWQELQKTTQGGHVSDWSKELLEKNKPRKKLSKSTETARGGWLVLPADNVKTGCFKYLYILGAWKWSFT